MAPWRSLKNKKYEAIVRRRYAIGLISLNSSNRQPVAEGIISTIRRKKLLNRTLANWQHDRCTADNAAVRRQLQRLRASIPVTDTGRLSVVFSPGANMPPAMPVISKATTIGRRREQRSLFFVDVKTLISVATVDGQFWAASWSVIGSEQYFRRLNKSMPGKALRIAFRGSNHCIVNTRQESWLRRKETCARPSPIHKTLLPVFIPAKGSDMPADTQERVVYDRLCLRAEA